LKPVGRSDRGSVSGLLIGPGHQHRRVAGTASEDEALAPFGRRPMFFDDDLLGLEQPLHRGFEVTFIDTFRIDMSCE
jgi:hypothetical protein